MPRTAGNEEVNLLEKNDLSAKSKKKDFDAASAVRTRETCVSSEFRVSLSPLKTTALTTRPSQLSELEINRASSYYMLQPGFCYLTEG